MRLLIHLYSDPFPLIILGRDYSTIYIYIHASINQSNQMYAITGKSLRWKRTFVFYPKFVQH